MTTNKSLDKVIVYQFLFGLPGSNEFTRARICGDLAIDLISQRFSFSTNQKFPSKKKSHFDIVV
tara:strand:- start:423 stop:614 length:192 start_codon:yes stop_codon:yes gene_type:complete